MSQPQEMIKQIAELDTAIVKSSRTSFLMSLSQTVRPCPVVGRHALSTTTRQLSQLPEYAAAPLA